MKNHPLSVSTSPKVVRRSLAIALFAAVVCWFGCPWFSNESVLPRNAAGKTPAMTAAENPSATAGAPFTAEPFAAPSARRAGIGESVSAATAAAGQRASGTGGIPVSAALPAESVAAQLSAALRRIEAVDPGQADRAGRAGTRFFAQNPGQNLCAFFHDDRLRVESGCAERNADWHLELGFQGIARSAGVSGSRLDYRHADGTVEWFENREEGIEHGYILERRPASSPAETATIRVPVSGLRASQAQPDRIDFLDAAGRAVAGYTKLKVWDAEGRVLPATMNATETGDGILLAWQDAGAVYPVTVDPLIIQYETTLQTFSGTRDNFGAGLAMDGNLLVVGCPGADTIHGMDSGLLYVFQRDTQTGAWSTVAGLSRPSSGVSQSGYGLGSAVAVRGDLIVGGAPAANLHDNQGDLLEEKCGEAVVFRRIDGNWVFEAVLQASDADGAEIPGLSYGRGGDSFGSTVGVDGDVIVVGAPGEDPNNIHADGDFHGAVYFFVETTGGWDEAAKFNSSGENFTNGTAGSVYGSALSISGDTVAVGAKHATLSSEVVNFQAGSQGAVEVLVRTGPTQWTLQQTFVQPGGPKVLHQFGLAVCVEGDTLIIGAPGQGGYDSGNYLSERAWVYTRSGGVWTVQAQLTPQDAISPGMFGTTAALRGDVAVIGAPFEMYRNGTVFEQASQDGAAYVFNRVGTSWVQSGRIAPDATMLRDNATFGLPLAVGDGAIAIGATRENPQVVMTYAVEGSSYRVRDTTLSGAPGPGLEGATVRVVVGEQVFSISTTDATGVFPVDEAQVDPDQLYDLWISKDGVERVYQAVRLSDPEQRNFVLPVLLRARLSEELEKLETTAPLVTAYDTAGARNLLAEWNSLMALPAETHQDRDRALARLLLATQGLASVFSDTHQVSMDAAKLTVSTFLSLTSYRKIISDATAKAARNAELAKLVQGTSIERAASVAFELFLKAASRAVGEAQRALTGILQAILPPWAVQLFDQAVGVVTKSAFAFVGENNNNGTNDWETNLKRNNSAAIKASLQTLAETLIAEVGGRILSSAYVIETRPSLNLAAARTRNQDYQGTYPEAANAAAAVWSESQEKTAVTLDFSKTVGTITRDVGTIADFAAICAKRPGGQVLATMATALRAFNNALLIDATYRDYSLLLENAFERGPQVAELPFRPFSGGGGGPAAAPPTGDPDQNPPQPSPPAGFNPSAYISLLNSIRGRVATADAAGLLDDAELLGDADDSLFAALDLLMQQLATSARAAAPRRDYLDRELIAAADLAGQLQLDQMRLYPALAEKILPGIASPALPDAEILALIDQMVARLQAMESAISVMLSWTSDLVAAAEPVVLRHGLPDAQQVLGARAGMATLHAVIANAGGTTAEAVTVTLEVTEPDGGGPAAITPLSPVTISIGSLAAGTTSAVSWQVRLTDTSPLANGIAASYLIRVASAAGPAAPVFGIANVTPAGGTFADWIASQPGVAADEGFLGDPDQDGNPTAVERYFGNPPGLASGSGWLGRVPGMGGAPSFVHRRSATPGEDMLPSYEWSRNLRDWHPAGAQEGELTVNLKPRVTAVEADGSLRVEVTPETVGGADMPGALFLRLGVSPLPAPAPDPSGAPPQIEVQPVGGSFEAGTEVTLDVQVAGNAPVTYLWHRNGQPLFGEVSRTLTLPALDGANSGSYKVVITGEGGQVVSDEVIVELSDGGGGGTF